MPRTKPPPPPFAPLYRDYEDSLGEVVLSAGMLADCVQTLLEVGAIPGGTAASLRLSQALARYRRAWDGGDGKA